MESLMVFFFGREGGWVGKIIGLARRMVPEIGHFGHATLYVGEAGSTPAIHLTSGVTSTRELFQLQGPNPPTFVF